jgi:uncharacterized membrane protein YeaQ/YmgE (transglycosylase-associated protein family)
MIIGLLLTGLVIGALGRLLIPGPNPMGIGLTILVGIAGALLGGLIGSILFDAAGGLLLSVPAAAVIVWWIDRSRTARFDRQG